MIHCTASLRNIKREKVTALPNWIKGRGREKEGTKRGRNGEEPPMSEVR